MRPRPLSALRIVLLALPLAGCSDLGRPLRLEPEAVLSAATIDFGTVAQSDSSTRSLTIDNNGTAPLTGAATVVCPEYRVTAGGGPFSIPPGGSLLVQVRFLPGAVGSFPCELDLGPHCPRVPLLGSGAFQATGARGITVPDSLDFGVLAAGDSATRTFQLFSVGTEPLAVNVVAACGDFTILSGGGPAAIPPGGSITVTVQFAPTTGLAHACGVSLGPGLSDFSVAGFATSVSFVNDVQPIFQLHCPACHVFGNPNGYQVLTTDPSGYPPGPAVIPFDLTNSVLYGKITNSGQFGQLMPEGGPMLPAADIATIKEWILEGARNN